MAQAAAALCFGLATDPMLLFCAYMVLQFCARSVSVSKLEARSTFDEGRQNTPPRDDEAVSIRRETVRAFVGFVGLDLPHSGRAVSRVVRW